MPTFNANAWTGNISVSDPVMRDGDLVQKTFWRIRNRIHDKLSNYGAIKLIDVRVFTVFIIEKKAKAVMHLYVGKSWPGGPKTTWKFVFPFPWLDADWAAELHAKYG